VGATVGASEGVMVCDNVGLDDSVGLGVPMIGAAVMGELEGLVE
jgi:hypothetical protein